jgi:hypothetical protein
LDKEDSKKKKCKKKRKERGRLKKYNPISYKNIPLHDRLSALDRSTKPQPGVQGWTKKTGIHRKNMGGKKKRKAKNEPLNAQAQYIFEVSNHTPIFTHTRKHGAGAQIDNYPKT